MVERGWLAAGTGLREVVEIRGPLPLGASDSSAVAWEAGGDEAVVEGVAEVVGGGGRSGAAPVAWRLVGEELGAGGAVGGVVAVAAGLVAVSLLAAVAVGAAAAGGEGPAGEARCGRSGRHGWSPPGGSQCLDAWWAEDSTVCHCLTHMGVIRQALWPRSRSSRRAARSSQRAVRRVGRALPVRCS